MTTLTIRSVRSIREATLPLPAPGQILGIFGRNGAGKSTIVRAAASALTRDPDAWGATVKARSGNLPAGATTGFVELGDEAGRWRATLPAAEAVEVGDTAGLPRISRVAAGLDRPAAMRPAERAALLIDALRASPTAEEWGRACIKTGVSPEDAALGWRTIVQDGWDAAAAGYLDLAKTSKGRWCEVTGAKAFASSAGATWTPPGHELDDLAADKLPGVKDALADAKQRRDRAIAEQGGVERERERLTKLVEMLPRLRTDIADARAVAERNVAAHELAAAALHEAPRAGGKVCACPECGVDVQIVDGKELRKVQPAKAGVPLTKLFEAAQMAKAGMDGATRRVKALEKSLGSAEEAEPQLSALPAPASVDLSAVEADIARLTALASAIERKVRAGELFREVATLTKLGELAGPAGIRKAKLADTLALLNGRLADMSELMAMPAVELASDLEVTAGGRPYVALSESERWKVDAVLALVIAGLDGSAVVLLDRADVLDASGRNALFSTLTGAGIGAVVAMTLNKPALAPDLAGHGIGTAMWVQGGTVEEIAPKDMEKAA